jgi:ABC-type glutathione transport system ATPase component
MNEMAVIDRSAEKVLPQGARKSVLSVSKGSKIYGGVHAIEGVDFDLYPGEVHALVGENGAGKSTLCKAIAGAIRLTSGTYCVDGKPVDFQSPRDALAAGICMVYQETSLVPTMTAAQNIELGNEKLLTRFRTLNIQAQQLLQSLNFHVDPATSGRWWRSRAPSTTRPASSFSTSRPRVSRPRRSCISSTWCATCAPAASPSSTSRTRSRNR